MVLLPVVELGEVVLVVQGVVLLLAPVVDAEPAVVVPLLLGVLAAEVVVPVLLQSVEVGLLVVPVVPDIEDELEGVVPIELPVDAPAEVPIESEFCCVLGVVPAAVPMPLVELPAVPGAATPAAGVVLVLPGVVLCPAAGVVLEPLTLPVAVELEVCPTPAGMEAVLPIVDWPVAVVPVVPALAPAVPAPAPAPAVPAVCAPAKAVQQSASVAVIKSFRMNYVSSATVETVTVRFR